MLQVPLGSKSDDLSGDLDLAHRVHERLSLLQVDEHRVVVIPVGVNDVNVDALQVVLFRHDAPFSNIGFVNPAREKKKYRVGVLLLSRSVVRTMLSAELRGVVDSEVLVTYNAMLYGNGISLANILAVSAVFRHGDPFVGLIIHFVNRTKEEIPC